jgi:hypothetical protein
LEKKAEELFVRAKQLLQDEEGALSPRTIDPDRVDKALRILEFCLQNNQLHAFHYLKDMARELLHAIRLERHQTVAALDMAPTLLATAERIYRVDHFERGQLLESLAQVIADTDTLAQDPAYPRLVALRPQLLQQALHQYSVCFGEQASPSVRIRHRLATLPPSRFPLPASSIALTLSSLCSPFTIVRETQISR